MTESEAVKCLSALAQETRLQILRYLISCGDDGAPAGSIAKAVDAVGSRSSFHLSSLEHAGIVTSERQSRNIIYRANRSAMGNLISFLLNDCCDKHPDIIACC